MAELFADRYEIDREVGRGGFGTIYLAHDNRLRGRAVALKVLHPALSADPAVVRLFQEEAGILASLAHDHVIPVYDAGVWEGRRYIVMQHLEGRSLAQVVADEGAQPAERVRSWLRQAASALAYAHEQGVLHRDVKSANLLLDRTGARLYVTDFGLAQAVQASGGSTTTQTGTLTGTAAYRAPEVAKTGHTVASDLYGLGVVAYELLAGRLPFLAGDPLSMLLLHATEPVPPLPATVSRDLTALVPRLLAKDPAARPVSAAELLPLLAAPSGHPELVEGRLASARPSSERTAVPGAAPQTKRPQPEPKSLPRWLPIAAGLIMLAVLAGVIWATTCNPKPPAVAQATATLTAAPTQAPAAATHTVAPSATLPPPSPTAGSTASLTPTVTPTVTPADTPPPKATVPPTQGIGPIWTSPVDGMVQVYVPAGEFLMGSADDDSGAASHEKPQHKVTLDAYWIDQTEVTKDQYQQCVAAEKCAKPWCTGTGQGDHPVVCVTWQSAVDYCAWAGRRLPAEAEWEKAARGTDGRKYPWGNQGVAGNLLNFCDSNCSFDWKDSAVNDGYPETAPVGSYPSGASPYGALDMAGNVWEWVADWYGETYYAGAPAQNPAGPDAGQSRVLRGGSWNYNQGLVRAAGRGWFVPDYGGVYLGFRCARSD